MKSNIRKIVITSLFTALAVVLYHTTTIRFGKFSITLYAIPLMLCGFIYGPIMGLYSSMATAFINQVITHGITPTTPLWMLAPSLWGLLPGLATHIKKNNLNKVNIIIATIITSLMVTTINTFAQIIDGLIYKYSTEYVYVNLIFRYGAMLIMMILYSIIMTNIVPRIKRLNNNSPSENSTQNQKLVKCDVKKIDDCHYHLLFTIKR